MNKVWECVIDVFIGILIMFVSVSVYFGLRTESVIKTMYEGITEEFVVDVKKNGLLTLGDYENYMERMGTGNSLFDISFEHRYKLYEPEYRFKTLEEILEEQNNAYTGSNDYHYREVITERPPVEDPINDGNLNTETNESILANAVNTPADPNHVHDEHCYHGHKHLGSKVFIHEHAHTSLCKEYISHIYIPTTCNSCHKDYYGGTVVYYWNENTRTVDFVYSDLTGTRECPSCGSSNLTNGEQIYYYKYSCNYNLEPGNERTPYGIVYQYEKTDPQDRSFSSTHTSGCYAYHITKELKDSYEYSPFINSLYEASAASAFSKMLYTDLCQGYCYIPRYIRVGISSRYYYDNKDLSSLPNLCYITYSPYVNADGEIRFRFVNYMYKNYSETPISGSNNPGFPTNISPQELIGLAGSKAQIRNYFKEFFGSIFIERLNFSDYTTHLQWFRGVWINNPGLPSTLTDGTEYVKICDFDHSLGTNRWICTCGLEEDYTLGCDKIIVSLEPTHSTQTVYINDPLIITAVATYRNGSSETVLCSTEFDASSLVKDREVTISYINSINSVNYTHNATITITVIPRNKSCPKGHIYNLNDDGSDPGCPYCREWVESLRVINPTTSPIVITIGTTLQDNNVKLLATYMDGHTEEVSSGYVDNLDIAYLGTKPVIIGYKGASVTVLVTTKCATMICDICGYEYSLYPDGTNPGCPRCIQKIPVFTGNIMIYEHINHTEEILDMLYKKKRYFFNVDDVFGITVTNKSSTVARSVLRRVYPSLTDKWLNIEKKEHVLSK